MQLDANVLIFDPDLTPGAGARDRRLHRPEGHRSHDADPRHLRAAREEPRRQAAGRAGAAALPAAAPAREEHDDVPADRRHRRARPRRDEARGEPAARARADPPAREARSIASAQQRAGRRAERVRRGLPIVAIVGYTNAGKSTLLNTLTRSDVLAEDKLFATLDPTTRRLRFPREREIIITDTVGFIRDLPHDLARAFRATLEELDEADLLLHVVDAADPGARAADGGGRGDPDRPGPGRDAAASVVMNKIDLVPDGGSRGGAASRTARCPWSPSPRRTARRRRRCSRRSRRRCGAAGSGIGRQAPARRRNRGAGVMSLLGWAAAVAVLLGVLILVHELGHFAFAKLFDVKVLRFSLGFGPKLFGFTRGETEYRLSLVPLGRLRAAAGRRSQRADPAQGSAARAGRQAAVAALHDRHRRAGLQPAAAAADLLRPLRRPAHAAAAHHRRRCCRTCRRRRPGLLPGDRVETVDGRPRPLLGGAGATPSRTRPARRCASRSDAARTPRSATSRRSRSNAPGPFRMRERVGWIGVSPRFHLPEIGVLDPTSPAAQAGLKTFDFITGGQRRAGRHLDGVLRAIERAGASPLRLNYVRGGYSAVPFAHIEIEEPGTAVVIPVAVFDAAGHRRYETGILSAELFVFSVEPGSPADKLGLRRGDQILALDGAPLLHWDLLRERLAAQPDKDVPARPGSRRAGRATRRAFARRSAPSWTPTARRSSGLVFGALNRLAWKTEPPVPITNRFSYALGHSFERTGQIIVDDGLRLRRDRPRPRPADDAGRPDHDRLRGRRRRRAGLRSVPVADGADQHQPRPAQLPARADPRRRAAGVLHAGAVQAPAAVAARARDRHLRRAGRGGDR